MKNKGRGGGPRDEENRFLVQKLVCHTLALPGICDGVCVSCDACALESTCRNRYSCAIVCHTLWSIAAAPHPTPPTAPQVFAHHLKSFSVVPVAFSFFYGPLHSLTYAGAAEIEIE